MNSLKKRDIMKPVVGMIRIQDIGEGAMKQSVKKLLQIFPIIAVMMLSSGCGNEPVLTTDVIAQFEGEDITKEEVSFYLIVNQIVYEKQFASEYPDQDIWQMDLLGTGNTLEEDVKSSILQQLRQMHILLDKAEEYHVELSAEDEEELLVLMEIFQQEYAPEVLEELQMEEGIPRERMKESMLAAKVKEKICNTKGWSEEEKEKKFGRLMEEWALSYHFTIRETDWENTHFTMGQYNQES